ALFLFAGDRARRTLARPRIGMGALPAHRKTLAVPQPAIAAEIHQPLDVHRDLPAEVALDRVIAVDQLAHAQYLVVGHLMYAPLDRNTDPVAYLERLSAPDAMNISKPDRDPLLIGDVDASDARHLRFSSKNRDEAGFELSQGQALYG